jgi:hypothetical protein
MSSVTKTWLLGVSPVAVSRKMRAGPPRGCDNEGDGEPEPCLAQLL